VPAAKKVTRGRPPAAALATWKGLNDFLRGATESQAASLLRAELGGKNRAQFVTRIHSRLNRVRADRERRELARGRF